MKVRWLHNFLNLGPVNPNQNSAHFYFILLFPREESFVTVSSISLSKSEGTRLLWIWTSFNYKDFFSQLLWRTKIRIFFIGSSFSLIPISPYISMGGELFFTIDSLDPCQSQMAQGSFEYGPILYLLTSFGVNLYKHFLLQIWHSYMIW